MVHQQVPTCRKMANVPKNTPYVTYIPLKDLYCWSFIQLFRKTNMKSIWSFSTTNSIIYYIQAVGCSTIKTRNTVGHAVLKKKSNDWWLFTHLLQLITPMTEQLLLGIGHLLTVETKHAGHQCRHMLLSPVASGCTIHGYALAPGTDSLPRNKWIRWDQSLIEGHRTIKPILHQVDLCQHLSPPEVPQWDGILWP